MQTQTSDVVSPSTAASVSAAAAASQRAPGASPFAAVAALSNLDVLFSSQHSITVMATPNHTPLALQVCAQAPAGLFVHVPIGWDFFPDGTPNIHLDVDAIENRDVLFLIDLQMTNMMPVLSALYAIPRYLCRTFTVICPFFPTGTMERVEQAGEVATAKTLARVLSTTPNPQLGEPVFYFFDIHALATRFFFGDNIKVQFATAVDCVVQEVLNKEPEFAPPAPGARHRAVIAFPDDGAAKRFKYLFPSERYDKTVFVKVRRGDARQMMFMEGEENVKGRHMLVVDDICFSGGTLLTAAEHLLNAGAASVSVFATHGVFPQQSWKKFLPSVRQAEGQPPVRAFYTTNSCPVTVREFDAVPEAKNFFKILSLAPAIVDAITGKRHQQKAK